MHERSCHHLEFPMSHKVDMLTCIFPTCTCQAHLGDWADVEGGRCSCWCRCQSSGHWRGRGSTRGLGPRGLQRHAGQARNGGQISSRYISLQSASLANLRGLRAVSVITSVQLLGSLTYALITGLWVVKCAMILCCNTGNNIQSMIILSWIRLLTQSCQSYQMHLAVGCCQIKTLWLWLHL
jgi:hypothetical protein